VRLKQGGAVAALALIVLWSAGCSGGGDSELRVPDGTPIILISVDTLRSDRLPAYGYGGVETPAIDRLREDGILFERAYFDPARPYLVAHRPAAPGAWGARQPRLLR